MVLELCLLVIMKFGKEKCKVLHLGKNKRMHQYKLRATWLESILAKKRNLGVLVDTKMNKNQQCALTANKPNTILGCISQSIASRLSKVILPFTQHW